jgi:hypothetical protein
MAPEKVTEEKNEKLNKPEKKGRLQPHADGSGSEASLNRLQQAVGNRAVQRLLTQRKGEGPYEVEDKTAERINRERDKGQSLDAGVAQKMGSTLGHDFSDVRVHNSPEAAELNTQLSAKAFTTGKDIFFGEGAYEPHSSGGQELLAHELTHVVQQGSGTVGGASRMTVNAPGDVYEQQADAVAHSALSAQPAAAPGVQREGKPDEDENAIAEKPLMRAPNPEEEEPPGVQGSPLMRQPKPEEEEPPDVQQSPIMRAAQPEEEEPAEETIQQQEMPEEEKEKIPGQKEEEEV